MTEILEKTEPIRYSVSPTAFFFALILAPIVVTLLTFWTLIGLFALPFGIIPYLVIGTPILLWAVGRIRPNFMHYASLGLLGNIILFAVIWIISFGDAASQRDISDLRVLAGFGLIFAPLWAGTFGSLYATFHPNIRVLRT